MADCLTLADPEYCPTLDDCHAEFRFLLPRGKAWTAKDRPGTTLWRFWRALAHPVAYAHQRICDLRRQFWCRSTDELRDQWLTEYGLPDACDPFPDLCAKVIALGGTQCDYYRAVALQAGWAIDCYADVGSCSGGLDTIVMDCDVVDGLFIRSKLIFTVYLSQSPAYVASPVQPIVMDCSVLDGFFACDADISALACIMERIVPAHVDLAYVLA